MNEDFRISMTKCTYQYHAGEASNETFNYILWFWYFIPSFHWCRNTLTLIINIHLMFWCC